jgi:hypothetical protein
LKATGSQPRALRTWQAVSPFRHGTRGGSSGCRVVVVWLDLPLACPEHPIAPRRGRPITARIRPHHVSGNSRFPGGVGNTQKDAERFSSLYADVAAKVFGRLPDATWVYPGHGGDTTLGAERPHLEEWRERGW